MGQTYYVQFEFALGYNTSDLSKAVKEIKDFDPDFRWPDSPWWYKPRVVNPRAFLAKTLSRYGLRGRLSVEEHMGDRGSNAPPETRPTGFSPSTKPSKRKEDD